ncbi:hypothetical protein FOVG_01376 [Fusarium oxysporum f. sp. pisi HDV247]|uniref:NB-ARC domain-containing protein n=1 Tax=Fusarium oxysporum f. sp. pisi HDV247 TaxID=1080344 RepID=W9Q814_FUSOX|nr:hypothetical protein FOVG_01376 [Fusarium oxysporum f. sp. pisi HDV247]
MAQTGEDMATAIFDIAHQCLDSFEQIAAKQDESILTLPFASGDGPECSKSRSPSSRDFLGLRNSFSFWVDYTGALSLMDSSLDTRLRGLTDIFCMVMELLEMILRNLQRLSRYVGQPSTKSLNPTTSDLKELQTIMSRWEDASQAIDSALDRLHFIAAAIRKASAKQLEYSITTFLADDDIVFGRDAATFVRLKFPSARTGLCEQLGNSIAVRRRILLHKHRHAKRLAVRRVVEAVPSLKQTNGPEPKSTPTASPPTTDGVMHNLKVPASGVTKASRPDPQAPVLRHLRLSKRPALTTVISATPTAPGDSFEYPPPPKTQEGETRVQCPYCLMPLDIRELKNKGHEYWRHHVDEDLKPYVCLFPECAEALVFFTRRHEWKSHMENVHSIDWPRKVHTIIWYCDIDHDPYERFETEVQWRKHMKNPNSHPQRQLTVPTKAQLDALSPRKQQVALRERFVCPLCEQIPEKVRPLVEKGTRNPSEMYESLVDHVANHIKSLSLMSLPCLDSTPAPLDIDGESIAIEDSFRRLMHQGSVPQPPSGIEYLDGVSLPPEVWSTLDRENIAALKMPVPEGAWDKEYPYYVHPDDPPEPLDDEWIKTWKIWKEQRDPLAQEPVGLDPVIAALKNAKSFADLRSQGPELELRTRHSKNAIQDQVKSSRRHWLVPFERNEGFVGREDVLRLLFDRIPPSNNKDACQRTIIEGLGGVGKSQIAVEAAFRLRNADPSCSVFWVPVVDATMFENAYRDIGRLLSVAGLDDDKADVKALVQAAISHDDAGHWLLIIDNVDDPELMFGPRGLARYLPCSMKGSILFTTRTREITERLFVHVADIVKITKMRREEAREMLQGRLREDQVQDAASTDELLDFLDDLPLAIQQASAYISKTGISIARYLEHCRPSDAILVKLLSRDFEDRGRYDRIKNPVATTWLISFKHISRHNPRAGKYLEFMCFLAERDIPVSLLPPADDEMERDEAIGTLEAYGFITQREEGESLDMHRLVRLAMWNWLRQEGRSQQIYNDVVLRLDEVFPFPEHENRGIWMKYMAHAQRVVESDEACDDEQAMSGLLFNVAEALFIQGRYEGAAKLYRETLEVKEKVLGKEHPDTLSSMNNLALVLDSMGKYEEALNHEQPGTCA